MAGQSSWFTLVGYISWSLFSNTCEFGSMDGKVSQSIHTKNEPIIYDVTESMKEAYGGKTKTPKITHVWHPFLKDKSGHQALRNRNP